MPIRASTEPGSAPRLARHRTVLALAALRVDRDHAGAEDHPAGPDRRALVMAVFPANRRCDPRTQCLKRN
jgi:hypothetical protein